MKEITEIGDIFMRYSDYLKIYTMYCSNQVTKNLAVPGIENNRKCK